MMEDLKNVKEVCSRDFDPLSLVRPNILNLKPYSSARDEYFGEDGIFLDANESPYDNGLNRYPDPYQRELKNAISRVKGISGEKILLGNGSDEVIDLLFRVFCEPCQDNVIICPPTYGMYQVAADVNNVECRLVQLDEDFQPDVERILRESDENSRLLFLCSPNNPTGNLMDASKVEKLLMEFPGMVVMDEAYIDFSPEASLLGWLKRFPNLVVLQTLSKAWGMAGIRLGIGFADPSVIQMMNKVKAPYNVSSLTQNKAMEVLENERMKQQRVKEILAERDRLQEELEKLSFVKKVYPSFANYILIRVDAAKVLYRFLVEKGIVIRDRSNQPGLEECLRISIGTPKENEQLLEALKCFELSE